ncbi:hypothetical protein SUBVAR_04265 [Subdoligranulum variabile DSM 15176]|uniref:Uncharacterized protein n=1 Tax=Subdoligranulum variabile DSM 15176 TaxID=411471 RepID=D1PIV0_9FIRM|nr:hypothetical protein SUBVAR_04265 [Subdoligranulum variabile DSM 15176]
MLPGPWLYYIILFYFVKGFLRFITNFFELYNHPVQSGRKKVQ